MKTTLFASQVCLITGGAQGLGWALAQACADQGARVFVCDISAENLVQAKAESRILPWAEQISFTQCDVADRRAVEAWITDVYRQTGQITMLINNAMYTRWADVLDMTVEEAEQTMRVGFNGMLYASNAVLPHMLTAGGGSIINIGSSAGKIFTGGVAAAYAAAKAAVDGYTQVLAAEVTISGIHVMLVRPGIIGGTDFFRKHVSSTRLPRMGDFVIYLTPPQVAAVIIQGVRQRRRIVNVPGNLRLLYLFYELFPDLFRRLTLLGGSGKRDYGKVEWRYSPQGG